MNTGKVMITVLLSALAGCATPPQPESSQIPILRNAPKEPYIALGEVQDEEICLEASAMPLSKVGDHYSDEDNIKLEQPYGFAALRKKAAKLGAQALFLTRVLVYEPTWHGQQTRGNTRVLFQGIAIRYQATPQPAVAGPPPAPPQLFLDFPVEVVHEATPPETGSPSTAVAVSAPTQGDDKTATLAPYLVSDDPVGCFGMSLKIRKDLFSQQVAAITLFEVLADSPAEKAGLEPLASIEKIDGRPVRDFIASLKKGSGLNRKLMHRNPGDKITLEILGPGSSVRRIVTLTEGYSPSAFADPRSLGLGGPTIGR